MVVVDEFIQNFLEHKVYDPEKAHEYYMKTRELKGRKPAANNTPSPIARHKEMDRKLAALGDGRTARAKAMPKLTPSQMAKAKGWIQTAEKYDRIYKSSGMDRKESDIFYSDKTDAEKNSALNELYKNPVYKRLDNARNKMFNEFLARPEIMRYYEILDNQSTMKKNAQAAKTAAKEKATADRLLRRPGKVRGAQM